MIVIRYSRGTNIHDVQPAQRVVANFAEFVDALDKDRAATKQGAGYFCAPLSEGSKRTAAAVLPRRWLALDLDRVDADVLPSLRLWFAGFSGAAWPSHSSTAERPRERIVLELDREVDRDEALAVGRVLIRDLADEFGDAVEVDPSTLRGEQPNFTPPVGAALARFTGDALRVDAYLEAASQLPDDARREHAQEHDRDAEPERASEQTLRDLADALRVLDADDRATWVRVGHALRRLGDDGRRLWLTWSATSPKYDEVDAHRVWTSCRGDYTGYRAVFSLAQAAGWVNPAPKPEDARKETNKETNKESLPELLSAVEGYLARFVAYPSEHARVAHALWVAHTHAMPAWTSTPRLGFLSPEPGSGKSRALETTDPLVPNAVQAINVTAAYLFRKVGDEAGGAPTVLFDEADTVFGPKARGDHEDIRGLLNAGHRRGAVAGRCVVRGKQVFTEELPAYAAVALAGLGDLPDTIMTRSIVVRMRRRRADEHVEPYRPRLHEGEGHAIRDALAAWAPTVIEQLADAWPEMPSGIADRAADVWEPLLAIADLAGGDWPARARAAAVALVAEGRNSTPSLGVRLLSDLRAIFCAREAMATEDIVKALVNLDEAPWGDLRGRPIDARGLAVRLRGYGVASKQVRISSTLTCKGYTASDLRDAWSRYLPPLSPPGSETRETRETDADQPEPDVSDVSDVSQSGGKIESDADLRELARKQVKAAVASGRLAADELDDW